MPQNPLCTSKALTHKIMFPGAGKVLTGNPCLDVFGGSNKYCTTQISCEIRAHGSNLTMAHTHSNTREYKMLPGTGREPLLNGFILRFVMSVPALSHVDRRATSVG